MSKRLFGRFKATFTGSFRLFLFARVVFPIRNFHRPSQLPLYYNRNSVLEQDQWTVPQLAHQNKNPIKNSGNTTHHDQVMRLKHLRIKIQTTADLIIQTP